MAGKRFREVVADIAGKHERRRVNSVVAGQFDHAAAGAFDVNARDAVAFALERDFGFTGRGVNGRAIAWETRATATAARKFFIRMPSLNTSTIR